MISTVRRFASGGTTTSASGGTMNAGFPGGGETTTLLSTTYYYYNYEGNVTRVVTEKAMPMGEPQYEGTRLEYARNGWLVTYGLGETWDYNGTSFTNHTVTHTREFRYDSARQRYLNRTLSSSTWSDYDGDTIYGDFSVTSGNPPTVTELRSFQPGIAKVDPWTGSGSVDTKYYHADMIGTTRHMTDSNGNEVEAAVYSAFGEQVGGDARRYGYAGASGYQTHDDFPFLHVGARYYDPAIGRFLQRDPIGSVRGSNVYSYIDASPLSDVDPTGLYPWGKNWDVKKCQNHCKKKLAKGKKGGIGEALVCGTRAAQCNMNCLNTQNEMDQECRAGNCKYIPLPPDWDPWEDPMDDIGPRPPPPAPAPGGGCGCTGLEAVLVLWILRIPRRRQRRR